MGLFTKAKTVMSTPLTEKDFSDLPVQLGDLVEDIVTGFRGLAEVSTKFLHGCDRLAVEPVDLSEEGKIKDTFVFDIIRLKVIKPRIIEPIPPKGLERFSLGAKARDTITGFSGIISDISTNTSGAVHVGLEQTSLDKEGLPKKPKGFAGERIEIVQEQPVPVAPAAPTARPGGPVERRSAARFER